MNRRKSEKPNCYNCKYRREVPGSAHSQCHHPKVVKVTEGDTAPMAGLMALLGEAPIQLDSLGVTGDDHGRAHGWFNWPWNFDPRWLNTCDGFKAKATAKTKA